MCGCGFVWMQICVDADLCGWTDCKCDIAYPGVTWVERGWDGHVAQAGVGQVDCGAWNNVDNQVARAVEADGPPRGGDGPGNTGVAAMD